MEKGIGINVLYRPYTVHFITPEGEQIDVKATEGDTMLDLAQRYDIDLECMCDAFFGKRDIKLKVSNRCL